MMTIRSANNQQQEDEVDSTRRWQLLNANLSSSFLFQSFSRRRRTTTTKLNVRYVNLLTARPQPSSNTESSNYTKSSFQEFGPQPKITDLQFENRPCSSNSESPITYNSLACNWSTPARDDQNCMLLVCPMNFVTMMTRHQGDDFLVTSMSM